MTLLTFLLPLARGAQLQMRSGSRAFVSRTASVARSARQRMSERVDVADDAGAPGPRGVFRGASDRSKPKRKVCVHVGFLGSNYHGMLYQESGLPTIERELFVALNRWGGISDDNAEAPSKVGWQRASRTDKGVHAIGATVSLKLLLADEQLESQPTVDEPTTMLTCVKPDELDELNKLLPDDIRIWSIQRTRSGFDAYDHCSARRYLYLLPESALGPGGPEAFNRILAQYTGSHAFHNFAAGVRAKPSELAALDPSLAAAIGWPLAVHPFKPRSEAFRTVLRCELAPEPIRVADGTRYWAVQIHGRSFLLHQIRHMIGAALAVAHGLVPAAVFETALTSPLRVDAAPLAPGEGLALLANEFFNEKTKSVDVAVPARAAAAMLKFETARLAEHVHALYAHGATATAASAFAELAEDGGDDEAPGARRKEGGARPAADDGASAVPGRRQPFLGWAWWQAYLEGATWRDAEQAARWHELPAAHARWREAVRAEETARAAARAERGARAQTVGGEMRERERALRPLPRGTQTAVAVALKLLPGAELEAAMAKLGAAVEAGTLPPKQSPGFYADFLVREAPQ